MDLRKLKTLIDLVADSSISELEITEGEGKVRIVKEDKRAPMAYQTAPVAVPPTRKRPTLSKPAARSRLAIPCASSKR